VIVDTVLLTPLGAAHAVVSELDRPTLIWHQDTWELPPDGDLLAETRYPQAFRKGSALGIQAHPEASPEIVKGWIDHWGREWLAERGHNADELLGAVETSRDESERVGRDVFEAWVAQILSR
jgi:GMP synthase (glutamine-hydrolysing)